MTPRNPTDAYLTPACAALVLRRWFRRHAPEALLGGHWADIFAGAGTLLEWAVGSLVHPDIGLELLVPRSRLHADELDPRWRPELLARFNERQVRTRDSFEAARWDVCAGLVVPHIVTNPPYVRTPEAIVRLAQHARAHRRWCAALLRTDWWQHPERHLWRPDHFLLLEWRPAFGFRTEKGTGKVVLSTDRYTGYVWAVWSPVETGRCELEFLEKPSVPEALRLEHRRVARLAFDYAASEVA